MHKKIVLRFFYIAIFFFILSSIYYFNFRTEEKIVSSEIVKTEIAEEENYTSSNILKNVKYSARDINGNQLLIEAKEGEIDIVNKNVIFLREVNASITLNNSENITITSKFGKYNINNFDTIFSKNVIINYLDNNIRAEYLDFSLKRNSMIVSKKVIYTNNSNILNADVVEININTKDAKIFMYEKDKKVNIKSKN